MSLDWQALHALIGAEPAGEADLVVTGVNSLKDAGPGEISFLGNSRYAPQLRETKASAVLVSEDNLESPSGCELIRVQDASDAFTKLIGFFQETSGGFRPGVSPSAHIDDTVVFDPGKVQVGPNAVIEEGATVGDGTIIGAGCLLGAGVTVGKDCVLHSGSVVREKCVLGDRVVLQPGAVIGSDGYGYRLVDGRHEKVPQVGIVELEDDVEIGANSCIDRARFGKTVIGEGTKVDNLVQVAHNVKLGKHCLLVSQSGIAGSSELGDYVTIAAQSGVAGHLEIGSHIVLAAKSGFLKGISRPGVYMGTPARPMAKEQRKLAALARLPKLKAELQEIKKKLEQMPGE